MASKTVTAHEALIYTMVVASAVDGQMRDEELSHIGRLVRTLPTFDGFDVGGLLDVSQECSLLLGGETGLEDVLTLIRDSLPDPVRDTAYALAVEVTAADLVLRREELRFLSRLRDTLSLDKLTCAAIERSAMARYRRL